MMNNTGGGHNPNHHTHPPHSKNILNLSNFFAKVVNLTLGCYIPAPQILVQWSQSSQTFTNGLLSPLQKMVALLSMLY